MEKHMVEKEFINYGNRYYVMPENVDAFLAFWKETFDKIPEKFRASAKITIRAEPDYDNTAYLDVKITYARPETAAEEAARLWQQQRQEDEQRFQELETLERLRTKYGV